MIESLAENVLRRVMFRGRLCLDEASDWTVPEWKARPDFNELSGRYSCFELWKDLARNYG